MGACFLGKVVDLRNVILGILSGRSFAHHNTNVQIEINIAPKKVTLSLFKLLLEFQPYLATKFFQVI